LYPSCPAAEQIHRLRRAGGDTVVVAESGEPWWIGDVIAVHSGPRAPTVPDFTQVINVDPGGWVRWVDSRSVVEVLGADPGDSSRASWGSPDRGEDGSVAPTERRSTGQQVGYGWGREVGLAGSHLNRSRLTPQAPGINLVTRNIKRFYSC
jgi:hypothetical protein